MAKWVQAAASLGLLALLAFAAPAGADTIKVLAAGAVKAAIVKSIAPFEARTGHKVIAEYDTVGALRDRILKGEKADIVLLSAQAITAISAPTPPLATQSVGKTGVGLGIPVGQPKPPLATIADFIAIMRAARSISYADPARGATAGTHFRAVLTKLGIADELAPRIKVAPSGIESIFRVQKGEIELGVSQATEIIGHAGVEFVGLLPDEIQLWTIYRLARFSDAEAARGFAAALASPEGLSILRAIGFQPE